MYYSGFDKLTDTMFAGPGFGWHADTGLYALRLIFSGVFDRLPDLQIILGHWGEVVLFYLDRIDSMGRVAKHLAKPISEYFRSNFYVAGSGILSQRYLLQCIDLLGIDRIVYSTDYPYRFAPGGEARRFLMEAPIEDEAKRKIAHGNWERLTGRETACAASLSPLTHLLAGNRQCGVPAKTSHVIASAAPGFIRRKELAASSWRVRPRTAIPMVENECLRKLLQLPGHPSRSEGFALPPRAIPTNGGPPRSHSRLQVHMPRSSHRARRRVSLYGLLVGAPAPLFPSCSCSSGTGSALFCQAA